MLKIPRPKTKSPILCQVQETQVQYLCQEYKGVAGMCKPVCVKFGLNSSLNAGPQEDSPPTREEYFCLKFGRRQHHETSLAQ